MNENERGQVSLVILLVVALLFLGFTVAEDRKMYPSQTVVEPCTTQVHTYSRH